MTGPSRRNFLGGLAAAGVVSLLGGIRSAAQPAANPRRIDVHHHFTPPAYLEFLKVHNQGGGIPAGRGGRGRGSAYPGWTLAEDLDDMDRSGTAVAILSITTPGFWFGEVKEVRKVVRESNEYAAKLRSDHPGRFGSFASIPITDTEGALQEIEYALDTLKADGIGLYSNYGDIWLGDAKLAPVHEELNRRKAVVYVHPIEGNCCRNIVKDVADTVVEYGADTTRTIASLIFSGTTSRYPDTTWILSHGGGMMPFVIERFVSGTEVEIVPGIVTKARARIRRRRFPKARSTNCGRCITIPRRPPTR
jgi:predicted TIM-barrel fold metal-dependent hydrolase